MKNLYLSGLLLLVSLSGHGQVAESVNKAVVVDGKFVKIGIVKPVQDKQTTADLYGMYKAQHDSLLRNATSAFDIDALMKANRQAKQRLDSIVATAEGSQIPMSKQVFTYDKNDYPATCKEYEYNAATGNYSLVSETGYEWNDDGKMLKHYKLSEDESFKYEYELDADNYIVEQTSFGYKDNDWFPSLRYTYSYNASHLVTEEVHAQYNLNSQQWEIYEKAIGEYDDKDRLVKYVAYSLEDGALVPEASIYEYDEDGNNVSLITQKVDESTGTLTNFKNSTFTYTDGVVTNREIKYWNKERQNWDGGDSFNGGIPNYNVYIDMSYDDKGRLVLEYFMADESLDGEPRHVQDYRYIYEDDADGGYKMTEQQVSVNPDGSENVNYEIITHYLPFGAIDYKKESYTNGFQLVPQTETSVLYNGMNLMQDFKIWIFDMVTGAKYPNMRTLYDYDANGNITRMEDFRGGYGKAENDFSEYTLLTSVYENGDAISEWMYYDWNSLKSEYVFDRGFTVDYDFSSLVVDMATWVEDSYLYKYKVLSATEVTAQGSRLLTYYYSSEGTSGIVGVEADNEMVSAVYSVNGILVGEVRQDQLDGFISSLGRGIYIIRNGSDVKKIMR